MASTVPADMIRTPNPLDQVFTWIIAGNAEHEITEAIEKTWPNAKAKPLIISAMKRISACAEVDHDTLVGWCIEATRTIYQQALAAGDFGAALRAVRQLHQLAQKA